LDSAQTRAGSAAWQKQTTVITALQAAVRLACQREIDMTGKFADIVISVITDIPLKPVKRGENESVRRGKSA
jgi:uridine kinase